MVYTWLTYAIVDQHLYKLMVSGLGPSGKPHEFDSMVKAMSGITFEPIQRAAQPDLESASSSASASDHGNVPRFVSGGHGDFYPTTSKRRNEHGIVDVEFSIDGQGHVQQLKELFAASRDLGAAASAYLLDAVFRVPADWEATGSSNKRFVMEFQYFLAGPGATCPGKQTPRAATALCEGSPMRGMVHGTRHGLRGVSAKALPGSAAREAQQTTPQAGPRYHGYFRVGCCQQPTVLKPVAQHVTVQCHLGWTRPATT
jgi:hypothetical protein